MAAHARARYIADQLQVHFDDLAFLWSQRREAIHSRRHTLRDYGALNERIEAHAWGLLAAPSDALLSLLKPRLSSPERDDAFASGYALLRMADASVTQSVVIDFSKAPGDTLQGLRDALSMAAPPLFVAEMQSALEQAKPITAVSAAVVLANQRLLDMHSTRLGQLLQSDDPLVCELAWRAAAVADSKAPAQAPERSVSFAVKHASPAVRDAGWNASAWSGQSQNMPLLRELAAGGDSVALHWLCVLGDETDVALLQKAALAIEDAAARCELLARFGHPSALNALVRWMESENIALACAAGEAFTRMTGIEIRGRRTTLPVPDDADDFTREMAPDVWLPDVAKARALMERRSSEWAAGTRWCKGVRLDGVITPELLMQLDLEARWDVAARAAMAGQKISAPPPIH